MLREDKARALRRALIASVSLIVLVGPAHGADLPVTKAPPPAAAASWAGFYLGVHGGYGWSNNQFSDPQVEDIPINGIRSQGWLYGFHTGYNWQFGRVVSGLETDFSFANIKGSNGTNVALISNGAAAFESFAYRESINALASARMRLGWLPTDNVLLYGTAGLGFEQLTEGFFDQFSSAAPLSTEGENGAASKFGWVAGLGGEVMLGNPNWIGRLEYLHYDFGKQREAFTLINNGVIGRVTSAGEQTIDVVRAGVSYKFGDTAASAPLPYLKAPVAAPVPPWAGFYLGAHGGYAWGSDPFTQPMALFAGGNDVIRGTNSRGWVAGGQFGYNWQYGHVVTGLEADLSATDIKGATTTGVFGTASTSFDEKTSYLGTIRGRLGWSPIDTVLLYGTAGFAWERFNHAETDTTSDATGVTAGRDNNPADQLGWVAGLGAEIMLGSTNWIGRLEYLHYDFGHTVEDITEGTGSNIISSTTGHQTVDIVRAGVSYKFGPNNALTAASAMYGKAPATPAALRTWAGLYIGGHAGYGWSDNDITSFSTAADVHPIGGIRSQGWLAGGHVGYNWQYANLVAGLEVDGSATGIKGQQSASGQLQFAPGVVGNVTSVYSDDLKYIGTVRGRVGWVPVTNLLLYGTGGLAWEQANRDDNSVALGPGQVNQTIESTPHDQFGWVAGVGAETFIGASNWIARLEYLHYDFGDIEETNTVTSTVPGAFQSKDSGGHQTIETVRAGVSYKFTP